MWMLKPAYQQGTALHVCENFVLFFDHNEIDYVKENQTPSKFSCIFPFN